MRQSLPLGVGENVGMTWRPIYLAHCTSKWEAWYTVPLMLEH